MRPEVNAARAAYVSLDIGSKKLVEVMSKSAGLVRRISKSDQRRGSE
jgi:hypothetical protein